jgi:DNA-binding NtrC family response regulator
MAELLLSAGGRGDSMKPLTGVTNQTRWLKSPVTERAEGLRPMVELLLDPYFGKKTRIRLYRTRYVVGSAEDCDIRISDPHVSPRHAELVLEKGESSYKVADLGSKNGVFLNGVKVQCAPLPGQGSLRLGRSSIAWGKEGGGAVEAGRDWVVADPVMKETILALRRVAKSGLPVLLLGETGTGKEFLARMIHDFSPRARGPYVAVNGALTGGELSESELFGHRKGAFTGADSGRAGALRSAHGGSLFLDEVGDIPASAQVKLLRVLETGEVKALGSDQPDRSDFRLVSATSLDLEARATQGAFRWDLYYRIAGFVVHVPPLRERPQDIIAITARVLRGTGISLDRESEGKLLSYRWPGNVRELKSCLVRALVEAQAEGAPTLLPSHITGLDGGGRPIVLSRGRGVTLQEMERTHIQACLERNGWSRGISARELGIGRTTLFEKMRKYEIRDKA